MLRVSGASVRYPGASRPALADAGLSLEAGELLAVTGPNGCGKTTLVRAVLGLVELQSGSVTVEGRPVRAWRRAELAQAIALLPQREESPFSWRVEEMVAFGRYARRGAWSPLNREDHAAVERSLVRCDVAELRGRRIETLSGGEWQRVRIARALAQDPRILVLDEPTSLLDIGHEMELFELVRGLVREGLAALVVTHNLNLAARYASTLLLLDQGRTAAAGAPVEVLQEALLTRVFRWPLAVMALPDGTPQILPLRPERA